MQVGIHDAKTQLSKLIPLVLSGEEVIITRSGYPLVKLVPVEEQPGERPLGVYAGKVKIRGDLLEAFPEEILDAFWGQEDDNATSA